MRLTRRQMRSDLRVWEARARLAEHESAARDRLITALRAQLDNLNDAAPEPSLIENIRLAHQLEQSEALLEAERRDSALVRERLHVFAQRHPDLFEAYR